jgi:hypothetical protein
MIIYRLVEAVLKRKVLSAWPHGGAIFTAWSAG